MPTRWVIRGLSGVVDDIDGCSFSEMVMIAKQQNIEASWKSNRIEMIDILKKAGVIWEESTPKEVLKKDEEIRRHYLGR